MRRLAPMVAGLFALHGTVAVAQVGYPPASSPYRDLEYAQELTIVGGQFHGHRDPLFVGPQSGLLLGAHYEWRAGGPANLVGDISRIESDRRQVDPAKIGTARELGTVSRPLYSATIGLGLNLTGAKSWHHFVPEVGGGLGLVSDFHGQPDLGGFKFGTRFALYWGGGIKWVPAGRWQVRGDLTNRLYTLAYPESFYIAPTGGTAVAGSTQAKSFWMNNPALTIGISRLF